MVRSVTFSRDVNHRCDIVAQNMKHNETNENLIDLVQSTMST
jgi:hypothetical protein